MPRRYQFSDFNTDEKPRITKGSWRFSDRVYVYRCVGRCSTGYGTTPTDAFNAWERNWRRRFRFYGDRHERALAILARH